MQRRTTALYFSPTGGTRTYVRAVAAAMPHMGGEVDLTRPEERRKVHMFGADDVVVLGVPVYYGRGAGGAGAAGRPTWGGDSGVLLAVYGNRLIDDALAELSDLCAARGFRPLAAGAFVAPHTFSAKVAMGATQRRGSGGGRGAGTPAAEKLSGPWCAPELAREPALPQLSEGAVLPSGGRYLHPLRLLRRGLSGGGHPSCRAPCDRR